MLLKVHFQELTKPLLGQFEYAIVWLSKNPIEIDCTDISKLYWKFNSREENLISF